MKALLVFFATILIWGAIWRYLAKFWRGKGRSAFTSHLGAGIVGFVVSMIFFGTLAPEKGPARGATASRSPVISSASHDASAGSAIGEKQTAQPVVAASKVVVSSSTEGNDDEGNNALDDRDLGMTPDQYAGQFDKLMKKMDLPFRARFTNKMSGSEVDSVRADFDERMGLIGRVSKKSGKLIEVTFIGGSDGTVDTAANIMMVAAAALTAAIPDTSIKSVSPKLMDMVKKYKEGGDSEERVLNGVKLYYLRGDQIGHWFGAKPS